MEVKSSWNRWHHQRQFPHSRFFMFMIMVTIIIVIITAVITFPIIKTTGKNIESNGSLQKDITNALFQKFDHCSSQIITIITNTMITIIITTMIMIMIRRSPGTRLLARPQQQPRRESTGGEAMLSKRS